MKVMVFGNIKGCGLCRAYAGLKVDGTPTAKTGIETAVKAQLAGLGITYQFIDERDSLAYAAAKKLAGLKTIPRFPLAVVFDDAGKVKGTFLASAFNDAGKMVDAIKKMCPECCTGTCGEKPATVKKFCTKCGQVLPILVACLFLGAGCRNIGGDYKTTTGVGLETKTVEVHISCQSLLWPSELSGADLTFPGPTNTVPGHIGIGNYKSTGGAAELVPLVDATGKIVGYTLGTAARTVVVP